MELKSIVTEDSSGLMQLGCVTMDFNSIGFQRHGNGFAFVAFQCGTVIFEGNEAAFFEIRKNVY